MAKSLDLLVVNVGGTKKRVYQELSNTISGIEPPFWAALTAGFIRRKGYEVKILDANAENLSIEETADAIEEYSPSLTNIVVYGQQPAASTQLMTAVGELCKRTKEINLQRSIILTGLHPSALPERTLREEICDFVGQGEGFLTIVGLLKGEALDKIPGLWYRKDGKIFSNPRPTNIRNLTEELPDVAWDLLPSMDKYRAHNWQCLHDLDSRNGYGALFTSFGCPHKCTFCSIHTTFGEHRVRYWGPEWVLKQIDTLVQKGGIKNLRIIDELFILNPNHFMSIAEGLIERNYGLNIWAYSRVDTIKEEYLEKLKKAGFNWLCLGIESGNFDVRKNVSKGRFEQDDVREVIKKIKAHDMSILGNYMFGLPDDNMARMQQTLDLAVELNCEFPNMYSVMAYPGSELYNEAVGKGWKMPDKWSGFSQHSYNCLPLPTNYLSPKEVLKFRDNAFDVYITNPKYLSMIENKFGLKAREHIEDIAKIKLKRKLLGD